MLGRWIAGVLVVTYTIAVVIVVIAIVVVIIAAAAAAAAISVVLSAADTDCYSLPCATHLQTHTQTH